MGQSRYLDGGLLGKPTQISLTSGLTHSGLSAFIQQFCSPSNPAYFHPSILNPHLLTLRATPQLTLEGCEVNGGYVNVTHLECGSF